MAKGAKERLSVMSAVRIIRAGKGNAVPVMHGIPLQKCASPQVNHRHVMIA